MDTFGVCSEVTTELRFDKILCAQDGGKEGAAVGVLF